MNRWPRPSFSNESLDIEYSFVIEFSNGSSSPPIEEDCESIGSSRVYTEEVIIFSVNFDEDDDIDILH